MKDWEKVGIIGGALLLLVTGGYVHFYLSRAAFDALNRLVHAYIAATAVLFISTGVLGATQSHA